MHQSMKWINEIHDRFFCRAMKLLIERCHIGPDRYNCGQLSMFPIPDRLNLRCVPDTENNAISMPLRIVQSMSDVGNAYTENYANTDNTVLSSFIHKSWFINHVRCIFFNQCVFWFYISPLFSHWLQQTNTKILSSKIIMINISLF